MSKKIFLPLTVIIAVGLVSYTPPQTIAETKEKTKVAKKQNAKAQKKGNTKKSWVLLCKKDKTACRVYSHIKTDKKIIVSSFSLSKANIKGQAKKQTVGIIMMPLGMHIPSGAIVKIDDKLAFKANLIECKNKGCRALFAAKDKIINHMKAGKKVSIIIVDSSSRKHLALSYSLKGFTSVYNQLIASK